MKHRSRAVSVIVIFVHACRHLWIWPRVCSSAAALQMDENGGYWIKVLGMVRVLFCRQVVCFYVRALDTAVAVGMFSGHMYV